MKIAMIGTGFVGVTQGACFAEKGHDVVCVDNNENLINKYIQFCAGNGSMPIYEPGLEEMVLRTSGFEYLGFSLNGTRAIQNSDLIYICVGTPPIDSKNKKSPANLGFVYDVAHQIGKTMKDSNSGYKIIVDKSTVPVGTANRVQEIIGSYGLTDFDVVSNPEFLAEGTAVNNCRFPDRVVIGTDSEKAINILREVYLPFLGGHENDFFVVSRNSAEFAKYGSNGSLAMQVAWSNILANCARLAGADWNEVKPILLADPRIGRFVHQGLGFGGSCFPKDVSELFNMMSRFGSQIPDLGLINAMIEQNLFQKLELNRRLCSIYGENLSGYRIGVWGLSFKAGTSDLRDAASLDVVSDLLKRNASIYAYDPEVSSREFVSEMHKLEADTKNLTFIGDPYGMDNIDALMILVEWDRFRKPDFSLLAEVMCGRNIFDGKGILSLDSVSKEGFNCYSVGRPDFVGH